MISIVKAAKYLDGYRILITFGDGVVKVIDLAGSLGGGVFQPLHDLSYFKQFRVDEESDTLVWPNGADFAPEYLYEHGVPDNNHQQHT